MKPCLFTDKLWIPGQPISVISRSAHSAHGTLFLLRDSSVKPRLLPDNLFILNNLSVKPCPFPDKLWIPGQPISVMSRSVHSAHGTLFLCIILILVDPRFRDSSVKPRLLPDKLLILSNLSVKPCLFTDKLWIPGQPISVISRSAHSAHGTLFLLRDSSVKPRLLPDNLFILNNLSVKPCPFPDKLWIPGQPISVMSRSVHSNCRFRVNQYQ